MKTTVEELLGLTQEESEEVDARIKLLITRAHKRILSQYKAGAKKRGHEFHLKLEHVKELVHEPCAFCGRYDSNELSIDGGKFPYMGIDRKDSKLGYTPENVVPCCKQCNSLKGALGWDRWADFINRIAVAHGGHKPFPEVPEVQGLISLWRGR